MHDKVSTWVLQRLAERGLVQGERIGVDASTMKANAASRMLVRCDSGEIHREMPKCHGVRKCIETPTTEDLVRFYRLCKDKTLSNCKWESLNPIPTRKSPR